MSDVPTPAPLLPQSIAIKVGGSPLSNELFDKLTEARVELSVGAAGHFMLRFLSDDGMAGSFKIGARIEISFDDQQLEPVKVFDGTVEGLAIDYEFDRRQLTVTGYDGRRKLSTTPAATTHTNASYKDILVAIANKAGLTPQIDGDLNAPKFPHVLQLESDLAFVHRIATERGLEWLVDDGKLIVRPRATSGTVKVQFGDRLRRLSARYSTAERPANIEVTGWDPVNKREFVAKKASSQAETISAVPIENKNRSAAANGRRASAWSSVSLSPDDASGHAMGIARRMTSGALVGRGETVGDPAIKPGVGLEISGVDADWNGTYYVTAAEHVYRVENPYITRFTIGAHDSSSMVDLLGAPSAPSSRSTPSARATGQGVAIGIVTNVHNDARDHAEVKVTFPYLNNVESEWARVAMPSAGHNRGIMFMPEVNDEVLVAFEHGDLRRAYVIGAVWNGKDKPPLSWMSKADDRKQRVIVSKNGHRMTFSDGGGDKDFVSIVLGDGKTTMLLATNKIEIIANSGKPIEVKNDKAKVVLTDSGDIQLEGENITIKAKQKIKIEGMDIAAKSQTGVKVEAGTILELKATAKAAIDGGTLAEIKGGMVKVN